MSIWFCDYIILQFQMSPALILVSLKTFFRPKSGNISRSASNLRAFEAQNHREYVHALHDLCSLLFLAVASIISVVLDYIQLCYLEAPGFFHLVLNFMILYFLCRKK